jgi:hypothetical protein
MKRKKSGKPGRAQSLGLIPRKKHGKTSVSVVEKYPDIPVAAVQYTFTQKQYTEYRERNVHNNKNT